MDRFAPEARRVARAVLGDPDEADDAAQDAFVSALVNLARFDPARPFGPWLMRIVANAATDRHRRAAVRRTEPLHAELVAGGVLPDRRVERDELAARLRGALDRLPPRRRLALVLYHVEGYSHAEIGGILGLREVTVRTEVFLARRAMRELLEEIRDR